MRSFVGLMVERDPLWLQGSATPTQILAVALTYFAISLSHVRSLSFSRNR